MATRKVTVDVSATANQYISGTIPLDVVKEYRKCISPSYASEINCMMIIVHAIMESKDYDETEWDYDDLSPEEVIIDG